MARHHDGGERLRPVGSAVLLAVALAVSGTSLAQRADGEYPATLFCEAGAGTPSTRDQFTLSVAGGRASYALDGGRETGSGTLGPGALALSGRGRNAGTAYEARYSGEIGGRGGLLTGERKAGGRVVRCQMTVGSGRG